MPWTPSDFMRRWSERLSDPERDEREGQAAFNTLHELDPELANTVRGSKVDPFYKDDRLPEFFREVFGG
jgi:hypothetical protein